MRVSTLRKPRIRIVTATEAKNRFGDLILGAYSREEHLIVKRNGIPVVAIVPMADYERFVRLIGIDADFEAPQDGLAEEIASSVRAAHARRNLAEFLAEAHAQAEHMPTEEAEKAEQDILDAIRAVRAGK